MKSMDKLEEYGYMRGARAMNEQSLVKYCFHSFIRTEVWPGCSEIKDSQDYVCSKISYIQGSFLLYKCARDCALSSIYLEVSCVAFSWVAFIYKCVYLCLAFICCIYLCLCAAFIYVKINKHTVAELICRANLTN